MVEDTNGGHKSRHDLCPFTPILYIYKLSEEQREKYREKREHRRIERA
jgi:hypothetical protein